jgi:transposase
MGQVTLLTGPERHRRWRDEERQEILSAAFAPGGSVAAVARRFEVATSLIYKWRQQSRASEACPSFVPAVVAEEAAPLPAAAPSDGATIVVELPSRIRVTIGAAATAALVTATLRALR